MAQRLARFLGVLGVPVFGMALEKWGAFVVFEREEKAACGGDAEWGGWVPWLPEYRQFSYGKRCQVGSLRKERAAVPTTTSPVLVSTAVLILATAAIASFG